MRGESRRRSRGVLPRFYRTGSMLSAQARRTRIERDPMRHLASHLLCCCAGGTPIQYGLLGALCTMATLSFVVLRLAG